MKPLLKTMLRLLGLSSAEASSKGIDDTRSLVKAAANAKATFDAAYVTAESDFLSSPVSESNDYISNLYLEALDSVHLAGKSAFQCDELSELERRYWANHHVASYAYLKMTAGLPEESWEPMQNAALDMEVVENNGSYLNEDLKALTDEYSGGVYYSAAVLHAATGRALRVLESERTLDAKAEYIRAAQLVKENEAHDISDALRVILEVTSSLLSMSTDHVSTEEAMQYASLGLHRVSSLLPKGTPLEEVLRRIPSVVELVDFQALGLSLMGDESEAKRLLDAIDLSQVPITWREPNSVYSIIKRLRG